MSEWQPISTAPKDGTWIMAWRKSASFGTREPLVFVTWFEDAWSWPDDTADVFDDPEGVIEAMNDTGDFYSCGDFSHWMPLPPPPATP